MRKRKKKLDQDECIGLLDDNIIGTLSLTDGERPYAVQLEYIYHEGALYFGTYMTGRKIDYMNKNDNAVFTVYEDRHGHPDMIKKGIPCRSVMIEGQIRTIDVKEFTSPKGVSKSYRLLKLEIEDIGSWQCSRSICSQVKGIDRKQIYRDWVEEVRTSNPGL